ncbi:MAG: TauD/TfdA family dioxygenase, partial [Betaproteobacteria bacterium]
PSISMLRMEVVPPVGGDTLFMDMRQIFASLSPRLQTLLKGLTARHDPIGHYLYLSGQKALHELPSAHHPIVRQIPETGDQALYVNEGFTQSIDGLPQAEQDMLLGFLFKTIRENVIAQLRVKWQPHTVVFWDNRLVQHHAVFDYFPHKRLGYRATIRGEVPVAAA